MVSFEGGVLTIQPTHGSPVSGTVTADTEIICEPPEGSAKTSSDGADDRGGAGSTEGDRSSHDPQDSGAAPPAAVETSPSADDEGDGGDDEGDRGDDDQQEAEVETRACGPTALVPGALVREAELRVGATGSTFKEITLIG